jgi:hypothetical protein
MEPLARATKESTQARSESRRKGSQHNQWADYVGNVVMLKDFLRARPVFCQIVKIYKGMPPSSNASPKYLVLQRLRGGGQIAVHKSEIETFDVALSKAYGLYTAAAARTASVQDNTERLEDIAQAVRTQASVGARGAGAPRSEEALCDEHLQIEGGWTGLLESIGRLQGCDV